MSNVTLSIDETLLKKSRDFAKATGTTLNAIIRNSLKRKVQSDQSLWLKEFFDLAEKYNPTSGGKVWKREDLYER